MFGALKFSQTAPVQAKHGQREDVTIVPGQQLIERRAGLADVAGLKRLARCNVPPITRRCRERLPLQTGRLRQLSMKPQRSRAGSQRRRIDRPDIVVSRHLHPSLHLPRGG